MNCTAGQAARESLRGLALRDGFGEQFVPRRNPSAVETIRERRAVAAALAAGGWAGSRDGGGAGRTRAEPAPGHEPEPAPGHEPELGHEPKPGHEPGHEPEPGEFLRAVAERTPASAVREGVTAAAGLDPELSAADAAEILGSGKKLRADDTVPFALWSAARNLNDLVGALWCTSEGLGDVDTTCAITGGVVAARTGLGGVPDPWRERCEPLPEWVRAESEAAAKSAAG